MKIKDFPIDFPLAKPLNGATVCAVGEIGFDAALNVMESEFTRNSLVRAAAGAAFLFADDDILIDQTPVKLTADLLNDMDASDAAMLAEAATDLLGLDAEGGAEVEGDGAQKAMRLKLAKPVKLGKITVTYIEFMARTYGVMKLVWETDNIADGFKEFVRKCGTLIHTGADDVPVTDEFLAKLSGRDAIAIAGEILPNFTAPARKLRKRQTS